MNNIQKVWYVVESIKTTSMEDVSTRVIEKINTVKAFYNDHPMGYVSAFWSSSRWPLAT